MSRTCAGINIEKAEEERKVFIFSSCSGSPAHTVKTEPSQLKRR